jgi:hypothetical protein
LKKSSIKQLSDPIGEEPIKKDLNALPSYSDVMTSSGAAMTTSVPALAGRPSDDELDEFVTTLKTQV